jgi:DNA sulfur modification protein DndD
MKIKWFEVENFGPYSGGPHRVNLAPGANNGQRQPLVVIQGLNGAGKTTLLKGILIAIHGKKGFGEVLSKRAYHERLFDLVPRTDKSLRAAVSVCVEYQPLEGPIEVFTARRSWVSRQGSDLEETFEVEVNSEQLDANTWYRWERFSELHFPPNLAPLFVFDGEKAGKVVSREGNHSLSLAYSRIFGLDVPQRLVKDLQLMTRELTKKQLSGVRKKEFAQLEAEKNELELQLSELFVELADLNTEHARLTGRAEKVEDHLGVEFSECAEERTRLLTRKGVLEEELAALEAQMVVLWGKSLPFAFCADLCESTINQIKVDQDGRRSTELFEGFLLASEQVISSSDYAQSSDAKGIVDLIANKMCESVPEGGITHDYSPSAAQKLIYQLGEGLKAEKEELESLKLQHSSSSSELLSVEHQIDNMGDEADVKKILHEAKEVGERLGKTAELIEHRSIQQERLGTQLTKVSEALNQIEEEKRLENNGEDPLSRAILASKAAELYLDRLKKEKGASLETAVKKAFNRLSRKGEVLSKLSLDSNNGSLQQLISPSGHEIKLSSMSEGEKQVFALSYLWGLLACDAREFPIVIDTPFGRLDSTHRRKIVEEFLVKELSQVVLLVTDEEANERFEKVVDGYVARRYHLDHEGGVSSVREITVSSTFKEVIHV